MDAAIRALAEPRRREILRLVRDTELTAGAIAGHFDVTRPAISQHLTVLRDAGLVVERRDGTRRWYRARPDGARELRSWLEALWDDGLGRLAAAAEQEERMDTPTTADAEVIERELRIAARPETVFAYFTDPARMVRWMGTTVDLDARPGGMLRIDYNGTDIARGAFVELDAPRRVVFTWGWEMPDDPLPPGASTVEVTLTPDGDGTVVRLVHHGLPSSTVGGHTEGWDQFLPTLLAAAETEAAAV